MSMNESVAYVLIQIIARSYPISWDDTQQSVKRCAVGSLALDYKQADLCAAEHFPPRHLLCKALLSVALYMID